MGLQKTNHQIYSKLTLLLVGVLFCFTTTAQDKTVQLFKSQDVKLLPSIFKAAEQTDLKYLLSLDPDRLLAPYLREAGLTPKAESYPNWENTGLDGHIGGHYLSALALMYAGTNDKKVEEKLKYYLSELKRVQDKNGNGYIGGVPGSNALWNDIANGKIQVGTFDLNKKWVPLYNIHKIFAGLKDAYAYTGNAQAKAMLLAYGDWFLWLTAKLSNQQIQQLLISEHGGLNETLADVYEISGNQKFLDLAYKFSDLRILNPLKSNEDRLNGLHANTQIPKVIGFKRIAELAKDAAYNDAAHFFWKTVVKNRTLANGGNSVREHFNPTNNFSDLMTSVEGPETCNSYNMLKLTKMLYQTEGLASYLDYYERTLYNHILSSQHPNGGFVYFTPLRAGHYRVYSKPETSFWCCVGSGLENHAKYNELIYAHQGNNLFVNLFIPSQLTWKEKGLTIAQITNFPETEQTSLLIQSVTKSAITLNIRYPKWVKSGSLTVLLNGKKLAFEALPGQYIAINHQWKKGDEVKVILPMQTTTEQLPDGSNYVAVLHGPILMAAKTDTTDLKGLFADDSRMGHIANGKQYPLQNMPMFVSNTADFASSIKPVNAKNLTYTASNLIYPAAKRNLELIPFYKVHDSRYIIYWQTVSENGLKTMQEKLIREEEEKARLKALTIDQVFPGEQQPESDHFIEMENSQTGVHKDRHWRTAKGWFSYKLNNKQQLPASLRLTYFGRDNNRNFKILVNDELIATVTLDGSKGDKFYEVDYVIPDRLIKSATTLLVKFVAEQGSETAGIYELSLIKR